MLSSGIPLSEAVVREGSLLGTPFKIQRIETVVMGAIAWIIIIVGISMFICIITASYTWLTSGGQPASVQSARTRMTNCLIGLSLVMLAWAIMRVIQYFFGVTVFPN